MLIQEICNFHIFQINPIFSVLVLTFTCQYSEIQNFFDLYVCKLQQIGKRHIGKSIPF